MRKAIGIDLGGTNICGGLVDEGGNILKRASKRTGTGGRRVVLEKIADIINELMEGEPIEGVGIGSPGFIDVEGGQVLSNGGNIKGWAYTKIREELYLVFKHLPVFIENDANVAAICEEWLGAAKGMDNFVMLTLGTGVGGAIYSKKLGLWHGSNYQGGELGHTILYPNGRLCICGQRGCVERYVSGLAVERNYLELTGERLRGEEIFKNSLSQPKCKEVVHRFAMDLAILLITLKNMLDPAGIVIGGGVINSRYYWWDLMIDHYERNCNNPTGTTIVPAKFLNDSGIIGAAKLVFDRV